MTATAPDMATNRCTFRCLETGHTFEVTVPVSAVLVLQQTATCWDHVAAAVRVSDAEARRAA